MGRPFSSLARWVRTGAVFILIITATVTSTPMATSAGQVNLAPSDPPPPIFLPMLMRDSSPPAPPSSFELIDSDVEAGKIDADTALMYKTFAEFDDARLPEAYRSDIVGGEAGLFMNEVVAAYPTLSAAAQAVVAPFFTPPFMAGSWAVLSSHGALLSAPGDWVYITAAGGKARVWYKKADAGFQYKAQVVAGALNDIVWQKETDLMGRDPILDEAGVQNFVVFDKYRNGWNSTFVPWGGKAGVAVPQKCALSASVIYINPALFNKGDKYHIGIVETTAHEFMHALQFSFPLAVEPCTEYNWLAEATATWAEDFVYPDHNTEHRQASWYLDHHSQVINDRTSSRDYGMYLLVYYYTHKYNDPDAVRRAWASAGSMDSLMSFMNLGGMSADQIASLWNEKPFGTFFKDQDIMNDGVALNNADEILKTTGFDEYVTMDNLYPGSLRVYHYNVDPSVRTITFLNGLTTKIEQGPYNAYPDDTVYNQTEVPYDDMRGANVVVMLKYEGLDEAYTWYTPARLDICQDWLTQRVSEILVLMTNQDMTDRKRMLHATGANSRILVSSAPCMKLTGMATRTNKWSNVTETVSASELEYRYIIYEALSPDLRLADLISPQIQMILIGGSVSWNIQGTDSNGCTYSGSDSFTITEDNSSMLTLQYQLLPGSRHFLGYEGNASTDYGEYVTYTVQCPGEDPQTFDEPVGYFLMADGETPVGSDGTLSGTRIIDNGGGNTTTFEWNLTPSTLP